MAPETVLFKWQGGKFYRYVVRNMPQLDSNGNVVKNKPLLRFGQETSYDSKKYYNGNPAPAGISIEADAVIRIDSIAQMAKENSSAEICNAEYLYLAGFRLPATPGQLMAKSPRSILLELLDADATIVSTTTEKVDESNMTVIVVKKDGQQHRFALDQTRGYALRQRTVSYESPKMSATINCQDFIQLRNSDLWLPKRVNVAQFYYEVVQNKPLFTETMTATEINNDLIPESHFVLTYSKPGTHISDATVPGAELSKTGRISYIVPANPEELEAAIHAAINNVSPKPSLISKRVIWANVAIIFLLAVGFITRRLWKQT